MFDKWSQTELKKLAPGQRLRKDPHTLYIGSPDFFLLVVLCLCVVILYCFYCMFFCVLGHFDSVLVVLCLFVVIFYVFWVISFLFMDILFLFELVFYLFFIIVGHFASF